jgi:hypothetical protein
LIMIVLLFVVGCSKAPDTETQQEVKSVTADTVPQSQVQQTPAEEPEQEPSCIDECEQVTAFCDRKSFYACVQEGECKKIIPVDDCGGDYTCENTIFCSSPTKDKRIGIMVKDQLLQFTTVKGNVGEEFSLKFGEDNMACSITNIMNGMVIFECD